MSQSTLSYVFALIVVGTMIIAVAHHLYVAFRTGSISFGYKYYPPGTSCQRKEHPGSFWFVVGIYGVSMLFVIGLLIFMIMHPIVA